MSPCALIPLASVWIPKVAGTSIAVNLPLLSRNHAAGRMFAEQAAHDDDPNDVSRLIEKGFLALNLAVRSELPIYSRIIASSKGRYSCA
jgi:hypothetical protein